MEREKVPALRLIYTFSKFSDHHDQDKEKLSMYMVVVMI